MKWLTLGRINPWTIHYSTYWGTDKEMLHVSYHKVVNHLCQHRVISQEAFSYFLFLPMAVFWNQFYFYVDLEFIFHERNDCHTGIVMALVTVANLYVLY